MTAADQEKCFKNLRAAHPAWTARFCSGYLHGASDEAIRRQPNPSYVGEDDDEYALGYLTGFAVYRGPDSECEPWFEFIGRLVEEAVGHTSP